MFNNSQNHFKCRKYSAFTLIELLLVITLLSIVFTITVPIGISYLARNNLVTARESVISSIREAQSNAVNMKSDSNWGVNTTNNSIIVYRGATYATRVTAEDLLVRLPSGVSITASQDINFTKFTGETPTARSLTISTNNGSSVVTINANGLVGY